MRGGRGRGSDDGGMGEGYEAGHVGLLGRL